MNWIGLTSGNQKQIIGSGGSINSLQIISQDQCDFIPFPQSSGFIFGDTFVVGSVVSDGVRHVGVGDGFRHVGVGDGVRDAVVGRVDIGVGVGPLGSV